MDWLISIYLYVYLITYLSSIEQKWTQKNYLLDIELIEILKIEYQDFSYGIFAEYEKNH